jgi:hypothetical protein
LKYEQLLSEKYFVETCFSKKYESYSSFQKLKNMYVGLRLEFTEKCSYTSPATEYCTTTTSTTTTTTEP